MCVSSVFIDRIAFKMNKVLKIAPCVLCLFMIACTGPVDDNSNEIIEMPKTVISKLIQTIKDYEDQKGSINFKISGQVEFIDDANNLYHLSGKTFKFKVETTDQMQIENLIDAEIARQESEAAAAYAKTNSLSTDDLNKIKMTLNPLFLELESYLESPAKLTENCPDIKVGCLYHIKVNYAVIATDKNYQILYLLELEKKSIMELSGFDSEINGQFYTPKEFMLE